MRVFYFLMVNIHSCFASLAVDPEHHAEISNSQGLVFLPDATVESTLDTPIDADAAGVHHKHLHTSGYLPIFSGQQTDQPAAIDRSGETLPMGWVIASAMMAFAFINTIVLGSTLFFTYGLFQWIIGTLAVFAPQTAIALSNTFSVFAVPALASISAVG